MHAIIVYTEDITVYHMHFGQDDITGYKRFSRLYEYHSRKAIHAIAHIATLYLYNK